MTEAAANGGRANRSVADAVVLGNLMITLLKNSDRVTSASLAQLVNVIAPIMTEPGGASWKQTTFHPFALTSQHARGDVLDVRLDAPTFENDRFGTSSAADSVATWDEETGELSVFVVNRGNQDALDLDAELRRWGRGATVQ